MQDQDADAKAKAIAEQRYKLARDLAAANSALASAKTRVAYLKSVDDPIPCNWYSDIADSVTHAGLYVAGAQAMATVMS